MNELDKFTAAVELTDAAAVRARFLDEACDSRPEQRNRTEAILRSAAEASRFLESPAPGIEAAATIGPTNTQRVGTQIGPYKLLQQIGEGGMATVFMAEQKEPVQRKVALKVIKAGMDNRNDEAMDAVEKALIVI